MTFVRKILLLSMMTVVPMVSLGGVDMVADLPGDLVGDLVAHRVGNNSHILAAGLY